jgi:hypothetical protein
MEGDAANEFTARKIVTSGWRNADEATADSIRRNITKVHAAEPASTAFRMQDADSVR